MPRTNRFKAVEAIGRTLADVEVTTSWGQPALKEDVEHSSCNRALFM
jgi:hypothetical protein